jgi:hypothetical protein
MIEIPMKQATKFQVMSCAKQRLNECVPDLLEGKHGECQYSFVRSLLRHTAQSSSVDKNTDPRIQMLRPLGGASFSRSARAPLLARPRSPCLGLSGAKSGMYTKSEYRLDAERKVRWRDSVERRLGFGRRELSKGFRSVRTEESWVNACKDLLRGSRAGSA